MHPNVCKKVLHLCLGWCPLFFLYLNLQAQNGAFAKRLKTLHFHPGKLFPVDVRAGHEQVLRRADGTDIYDKAEASGRVIELLQPRGPIHQQAIALLVKMPNPVPGW